MAPDILQNSEAIEQAEIDVAKFIEDYHKRGLDYWQLLRIFLIACQDIQIKADVEYHMKLQT